MTAPQGTGQDGDGEQPDRPVEQPRRGSDTTMTFGAIGAVPDADVDDADLSTEDARAVEQLPPHSALLVVQRGPNAGARFLLDSERTTAGRHPDSDIFLDDVTVSRKHAEFVRDTAGFRVRDVGSLNGTYVNRDRIDEAVLQSGHEVQIGKYRMVFHPSKPGADA